MTDERSPLDVALDLVVYAPIGLALSVVEEVPKLAAKGRSRLSGPWATARVVGMFAVAQGKREMLRRTGGGGTGPGSAAAQSNGATQRPSAPRPPADGVSVRARTVASPAPAPTASVPGPVPPLRTTSGDKVKQAPVALAPDVDGLAIPGYDSLSASQVVQRLAGLAGEELEAVRVYETVTRGRRTILARVSQLQGS